MYADNDTSVVSERLLKDEEGFETEAGTSSLRHSRMLLKERCTVVFNIALLLVSTLLLLISFIRYRDMPQQQQYDCNDFVPEWSPALEAVKGTRHTQRFDGSFAAPNAFKGPPSPEIDAAWDSITYATGGVIGISEDVLYKVNASAEYSVKLAPEIGGGYMASVEVLHQLHCLNILRQATYVDYYKDKAEPWQDSPQTLRYHLDHCIDNLRQKLMCDADAGILTYVWVQGHPMPFPDFNVQHQCRDFDSVERWVRERQLFTNGEHGVERMPDTKELLSPP